jgi:hypothetical protein
MLITLQNILGLDWVKHAANIGGEEWAEIMVNKREQKPYPHMLLLNTTGMQGT